jgi:hypothetical protein
VMLQSRCTVGRYGCPDGYQFRCSHVHRVLLHALSFDPPNIVVS